MIKSILGIDPVAIGAALLALITMIGGIFLRRDGKNAERQAQQKREAKAAAVAKQVDDTVDQMTPDERRKELGKWSPKQ